MRTGDGRVHLLRRVGERFREAEPGIDWPGYNGDPGGNRYTTLSGITKANVAKLTPKWSFTLQGAGFLQGTPVVVGGIMYMPASNECYALDAGTGRQIWHYRRQGEKFGGTNRGVAVAGDRVFLQTEKAHIVALNRFTGEVVWDTEMADWRQSYFATSAPLVAGGLVVAGIGGGEHGTRGFVAAYDPATGKEEWRFWTVPRPGEPKSETWQRAHVVLGYVRPATGYGVLAFGQSERGVLRRRSRRRQFVLRLHSRAGCQDRQAQVVLPGDAARPLGLGRHGDAGGGGRELGRPAAQAAAARQSQRLLLRVRPDGWKAAAGEAVH
jgi:outer membrane protein assembly factor BamB